MFLAVGWSEHISTALTYWAMRWSLVSATAAFWQYISAASKCLLASSYLCLSSGSSLRISGYCSIRDSVAVLTSKNLFLL